MEENPERRKLTPAHQVSRIFGIIMVVLYIGLGTTILFRPPLVQHIPEQTGKIFGIILILYGIFRAVKVYSSHYRG